MKEIYEDEDEAKLIQSLDYFFICALSQFALLFTVETAFYQIIIFILTMFFLIRSVYFIFGESEVVGESFVFSFIYILLFIVVSLLLEFFLFTKTIEKDTYTINQSKLIYNDTNYDIYNKSGDYIINLSKFKDLGLNQSYASVFYHIKYNCEELYQTIEREKKVRSAYIGTPKEFDSTVYTIKDTTYSCEKQNGK